MRAPPMVADKPLASAVRFALGPAPATVLVVGRARLAASLARAGHAVTRCLPEDGGAGKEAELVESEVFGAPPGGLERFDALVLVGVLARREDPLGDLRRLVCASRPGALLLLAEQAAYGRGGLWLGRLVGRLLGRPLLVDVSALGAICLNAGLTGLRQTWPQGLRSLVLIRGRAHPMVRLLAP